MRSRARPCAMREIASRSPDRVGHAARDTPRPRHRSFPARHRLSRRVRSAFRNQLRRLWASAHHPEVAERSEGAEGPLCCEETPLRKERGPTRFALRMTYAPSRMTIHIPAEVACRCFMHGIRDGRHRTRDMMLEAVRADVAQHVLQLRNLHDARAAKRRERILREPPLADIPPHVPVPFVGREARERHRTRTL